MSAILASGPGECCVKPAFRHEGTPRGSTINLGGLQSYVSHSTNNNDRVILFFPDIFGPFAVNNQLIMDYFASNGYIVVAPDYFEGDPINVARERPGFDRRAWAIAKLAKAKTTVPKWIEAVVKEFGTEKTKYGTVGYCFGGPFVLELCATNNVAAGAVAHPASLNDDHFRNVKQPLFLSCAEVDSLFPAKSRHVSEEILTEIKATYHYQLFSEVEHGFACRGNIVVERERWAKEESARGIVGWWDRFMS